MDFAIQLTIASALSLHLTSNQKLQQELKFCNLRPPHHVFCCGRFELRCKMDSAELSVCSIISFYSFLEAISPLAHVVDRQLHGEETTRSKLIRTHSAKTMLIPGLNAYLIACRTRALTTINQVIHLLNNNLHASKGAIEAF